MQYNRPIVLSIAGFDPSGGAGILADIKTFEQHQCLGFGVLSANTVQTEKEFLGVEWYSSSQMIEQLKPLLENYDISCIKIGIIENLEVLNSVCEFIHAINNQIKIIWDPVLSASSGFVLMQAVPQEKLKKLYRLLYLITPNAHEVKKLAQMPGEQEAALAIAPFCNVLLKGGHSKENEGVDLLFHDNKTTEIGQKADNYFDKHGTGCMLSSAIAANLAKGNELPEACTLAKKYVEKAAQSNQNRLAYHYA